MFSKSFAGRALEALPLSSCWPVELKDTVESQRLARMDKHLRRPRQVK